MNQRDHVRRLASRLKESPDEKADAAVAILIRPNSADVEFFLVKRAEAQSDPWSGDMAFPGGKKCPQDSGLSETAVREVLEETGIDLHEEKPLGYMDPLFSWVKRTFSVQPVVYLYDGDPPVTLNYELTKSMWVPMGELRRSRAQALVKGFDSPIYKAGGEVVWGLTYRMLEKLLEMMNEG